ncbi:MAG TPA: Arc family DNA-binding protein [Treponema sp.]|nr:Arc family DNA-binding protein [Treponema sp.]
MDDKETGSDKKKQIILRISPKLWNELAAWAEDDFRSINGQIEYLLTECVRERRKKSFDKNENGAPQS